jgi:pilus assembly protein CpaE
VTSVVEPDVAQLNLLQAMLHGSSAFPSMAELNEHLRNTPHEFAVVIGPSISIDDAATFAQWARVQRPDLGVILLRHVVDASALAVALRSGMREVVDAKDLAGITTAVQRVRSVASAIGQTIQEQEQSAAEAAAAAARARLEAEAAAARAAAEAPKGKVLTIFSTKGGVGKSLLAVNTAVALADKGHKVCLVDLDLSSGDVAIMLQLTPHRTVSDLVAFGGVIDEGAVEALQTKYSDNLTVVAAPVHLDSPDQASSEDIGSLLDKLKSMVDFVVVDTSGVFDDPALAALDRSDRILLIGTLDIPALKGLKLAVSTLDLLNYDKSSWRFVLNRADAKVGLSSDEFENTLGLKANATLTSSREVLAAVNRGEPLVRAYPGHANSKTLVALATTLATELHDGADDHDAATKKSSGRLRLRRA